MRLPGPHTHRLALLERQIHAYGTHEPGPQEPDHPCCRPSHQQPTERRHDDHRGSDTEQSLPPVLPRFLDHPHVVY